MSEHIDDWLEKYSDDATVNYAKFVIEHYRSPACAQLRDTSFMKQFELYARYEDRCVCVRYASSMGDICISDDLSPGVPYNKRVSVLLLSNWSPVPFEVPNE